MSSQVSCENKTMVYSSCTTIVQPPLSCLAQSSHYFLSGFPILVKRTGSSLLSCRQKVVLLRPKRRRLASSIYAGKEPKAKVEARDKGLEWPVIKRWDVHWPWQTISLTSLACGIRFLLLLTIAFICEVFLFVFSF